MAPVRGSKKRKKSEKKPDELEDNLKQDCERELEISSSLVSVFFVWFHNKIVDMGNVFPSILDPFDWFSVYT